uniref:Truncated envelope glycoprotein n=1 Tax=Human immunodeficiency virus type 1 TaxID=11676 RepID=A0A0H3YCQ2_HV1|nr:truncated envelope glycoprotein [Human immunodeficiency virus 1]
MRVRKIPRN